VIRTRVLGALLSGMSCSGISLQGLPHHIELTAGYHDHVWTRDEKYAMFSLYDGSDSHLFDLDKDPKMDKNIASANPAVVKKMFNDYIIKDAGGPLPHY
jgi:hypothetical protein